MLPDVTALAPAGCLCILAVNRYGEVRLLIVCKTTLTLIPDP
jgi:hypothetical protein